MRGACLAWVGLVAGCHWIFPYQRAAPDARADTRNADSTGKDAAQGDVGVKDGTIPTGDTGVPVGTWVTIRPVPFTMGATSGFCGSLSPLKQTAHLVTLSHAFEIQAREVTQGEFDAAMGYKPSSTSACGSSCPVDNVSWHEMAAYCNFLSVKGSFTPCYQCSGTGRDVSCNEAGQYAGAASYDCPGYRLPTEAEWEYAYRAGTTTDYYNGMNSLACKCMPLDSHLDPIAWYCGNWAQTPHPGAKKDPNAWGLYDMAGNVREWCDDWEQNDLGAAPVIDPFGATTGIARVVRGGSRETLPWYAQAGARTSIPPGNRIPDAGGRCVRTRP